MSTESILAEVAQERARQDEKWGEQNHPLVCQTVEDVEAEHHGHLHEAERFKFINDSRVAFSAEHSVHAEAWDSILLEEVHEAFCEYDPQRARAELIQVAAVAVAAIESIDRAAS